MLMDNAQGDSQRNDASKRARRMTRADAGRKGGTKTKERYGNSGFYASIGQKGGEARGKNRDSDTADQRQMSRAA
jgi:general stress protein YciG